MTQVDLNNPTLEFMENDPSIAERFGAPDSISYLMNSIADFLHVSADIITMPLMFLFNLLVTWLIVYCIYYRFRHGSGQRKRVVYCAPAACLVPC